MLTCEGIGIAVSYNKLEAATNIVDSFTSYTTTSIDSSTNFVFDTAALESENSSAIKSVDSAGNLVDSAQPAQSEISSVIPSYDSANIVAYANPLDSLTHFDTSNFNVDSIINGYVSLHDTMDIESFSDLGFKILMPNIRTMSAFGTFYFYKNLAGKILIAISMLMSLILLVGFKWIRSKKINLTILLINIAAVAAFIGVCFLSDITTKFGVWVLLFLLLAQFQLERQRQNIEL